VGGGAGVIQITRLLFQITLLFYNNTVSFATGMADIIATGTPGNHSPNRATRGDTLFKAYHKSYQSLSDSTLRAEYEIFMFKKNLCS
jgi:hypothetical protein